MNPKGQISGLKAGLMHPDPVTVRAFIRSIAQTYATEQNMARTAEKFGASARTLERCMLRFPDLAAAIEKIRNDLEIVS